MKNENQEKVGSAILLDLVALEKMKSRGFQYVQIKGFTMDNKLDYMEPRYLMLIPLKDLPNEAGVVEIYESVNSHVLYEWAANPNEKIEVFVDNTVLKI